MENKEPTKFKLSVEVEHKELDETLEKAKELVTHLERANQLLAGLVKEPQMSFVINSSDLVDKVETPVTYAFNSTGLSANARPEHSVIETNKAVYIDGNRINYVLEDGVKTKPLNESKPDGDVIVTISFIARKFAKLEE